jgi:acyl transferase domain-containing protein
MQNNDSSVLMETGIAVVGMACRVPGARNTREFWNNLRNGVESLTELTDAELEAAGVEPALVRDPNYVRRAMIMPDMEMFDAGFYGMSPKDAAIMDPQTRHFLECAWESFEDAGYVPDQFDGSIGVFAGSGTNAYYNRNLLSNPDLVKEVGLFLLRHTGNDKDFLATRTSYSYNLRGPSISVQTACSTSLVAIHLAAQSLLNGECDMALAGGATIRQPHYAGHLYKEGEIVTPDGHCRSFDEKAQGTTFGSGVGTVLLRRVADAVRDGDHIYAVIRGSAINNDGSQKVGYLAPSVDGQAAAVAEALAIAGVEAESIGYVEAHGTATPVGDPIEVTALTEAYATDRRHYCGLGSVKTNVGHLDTAAGVVGFIKAALSLYHGEIPASLHYTTPNPAIDFEHSPFYVNAALREFPRIDGAPRRAAVNSLGAGGTNAHVILEEPPVRAPGGGSRQHQLLMTSARSRAAVQRASVALASYLERDDHADLADVAYTTQVGRRRFKHRRAVVCSTTEDAVDALLAEDNLNAYAGDDVTRSVVFMFAGGGAQYPNMGRDLYDAEPVYRAAVDECLRLLQGEIDFDLRALLFPAAGTEEAARAEMERPSRALPALFTTQYAQAKLWLSWGVAPAAMIGHSMGEYTAACLSGVIPLKNALAIVSLRGKLFERVPEGGMLSVPLSADALEPLLGDELSIAVINGPEMCVASGPVAALDALEQRLREREVEASRIHIRVAAHSKMLEPILADFEAYLRNVPFGQPTIPYVSNLTGTWSTAADAATPRYWVNHLRHTVRFADGLETIFADADRILLEVGPGRTLATLARMHPSKPAKVEPLTSLRHPDQTVHDQAFMLGMLGKLWEQGASIDWDGFHGERRVRVPLPTYAWEHEPYFINPGRAITAAAEKTDDLAKRADVGEWFHQPSWRRSALPEPLSADGALLVFTDECGIGDAIADRAEAQGRTVWRVRRGEGFARTGERGFLSSTSVDDLDRVLTEMQFEQAALSGIAWCWTLTGTAHAGSTALEDAEDRSFYGPLHLVQALSRHEMPAPVQLMFATNRAQQVGEETELEPAKALVAGPARVAAREVTWLNPRAVDVVVPAEGTWRHARVAELLAAELDAKAGERLVAYRGIDRWVESFEPLSVAPAAERPRRLRERGVYLITGGFGGIGLVAAKQLAELANARLVLLGRTALPPREQWTRAAQGTDRTAGIVRDILEIEQLGGEVLPLSADVTDAASLKRAVATAREKFGAIHGVLHAAGVIDDGLLQLKTDDVAARVLAPKVRGTLALDEALAGQPLDFMMLFSSRSSVAGVVGQVDYTAANAFMDVFARERTERTGQLTLSVGWSAWGEVGMAAALQGGAQPKLRIEPSSHPLFEGWGIEPAGDEIHQADFVRGRHWLLDEHRIAGGDALIPGTGYLEIARAAFDRHTDGHVVEMKDVLFVTPFIVKQDGRRELNVRFQHNGAGAAFVISGRPHGRGEWVEHARGRIARATSDEPRRMDVNALRSTLKRRSDVFDGHRADEHLDLGARWDSLKRVDYGTGEALAQLELRPEFHADLAEYRLHPALMDIATACAKHLIDGYDEHADFYVPASYGSLVAKAALQPAVFSHIRFREDASAGKDIVAFDITIYDANGVELVDVREFVMVRVTDSSRMKAADEAPEAPGPVLIMPGEGVDALRRMLHATLPPHVIVSPQHLPSFLAAIDAAAPVVVKKPKKPAAPTVDCTSVETALLEHEAITGAAARAFPEPGGGFRVVAYVVYDAFETATVSELRRHLRSRVDEKLVPQNFVELTELPKNAAGDIDRGALVDPLGGADDHVAPRTATEQAVASIWQDLLGMEKISVYDNFLDVGGHSLLAMRALLRMEKEVGVRVNPSAMNLQTLEQISAMIDAEKGGTAPDPATMTAPACDVPAETSDRLAQPA